MKNLVLKLSNDGMHYLFWWNSERKEMSQIAEGKLCKQLDEYGYYLLLGNNNDDCQVYMQRNGKLEVIPVHCQEVEFIGDICTYQRAKQWYGFIDGQEILLGQRYEQSMSLYYKVRLERTELYYFVLGNEKKDFVLSLILSGALIQGKYFGGLRKTKENYILAMRENGGYDIYYPEGLCVYHEGNYSPKRYFTDSDGHIYFWDETVSSWRLVSVDGYLWAENAIVVDYPDTPDKKAYSVLFEVDGVTLKERARGEFKVYRKEDFGFDGVIYSKDYRMDCVDFEKKRYSFWRKVKSFFLE